jgi:pimeloyl-ACP methyl ester carboxylesterase
MQTPSRKQTGLLAAAVIAGLTAGWVAQRARRAERIHPPAGSFVDVDGVRVHYVERGQGPVVVLLHGNAVTLQDFAPGELVDELAQSHRVIVLDRPGFGFTERPRLRVWTASAQAALVDAALRELGVTDATVMGHSWSTLVALELALRPDSLVRKLVLVSGYYYPSLRMDSLAVLPVAIPVIGDVLRYTVSALTARLILKRTVKKMFEPEQVPPGYLDSVPRELLVRPSQLRAASEDGALMLQAAREAGRRYAEIKVPVTIIAGEDDRIIDPAKQSERLSRELSDGQLVVIPGAGHMLHHAHYADVASALRSAPLLAGGSENAEATVPPAAQEFPERTSQRIYAS